MSDKKSDIEELNKKSLPITLLKCICSVSHFYDCGMFVSDADRLIKSGEFRKISYCLSPCFYESSKDMLKFARKYFKLVDDIEKCYGWEKFCNIYETKNSELIRAWRYFNQNKSDINTIMSNLTKIEQLGNGWLVFDNNLDFREEVYEFDIPYSLPPIELCDEPLFDEDEFVCSTYSIESCDEPVFEFFLPVESYDRSLSDDISLNEFCDESTTVEEYEGPFFAADDEIVSLNNIVKDPKSSNKFITTGSNYKVIINPYRWFKNHGNCSKKSNCDAPSDDFVFVTNSLIESPYLLPNCISIENFVRKFVDAPSLVASPANERIVKEVAYKDYLFSTLDTAFDEFLNFLGIEFDVYEESPEYLKIRLEYKKFSDRLCKYLMQERKNLLLNHPTISEQDVKQLTDSYNQECLAAEEQIKKLAKINPNLICAFWTRH